MIKFNNKFWFQYCLYFTYFIYSLKLFYKETKKIQGHFYATYLFNIVDNKCHKTDN